MIIKGVGAFCDICGKESGIGWADLGCGKEACAECLATNPELKAQADAVHGFDDALIKMWKEEARVKLLIFLMAIYTHQMSGLATHYGHGLDPRIDKKSGKLVGFHYGGSGIQVNSNDPVAAHKGLPYGTIVRVINDDPRSKNYRQSTLVMIFDYGPKGDGRVIDMMPHSLWDLCGSECGGLKVRLQVVDKRYQCSGYRCLIKKLKTKRITDQMLLDMISG